MSNSNFNIKFNISFFRLIINLFLHQEEFLFSSSLHWFPMFLFKPGGYNWGFMQKKTTENSKKPYLISCHSSKDVFVNV